MYISTGLQWLPILWLTSVVSPMDVRNSSTDLVPIYEPFLSNLRPNPATFNPYLGGLDWNMCCSLVVNESFVIENGTLSIRPGQTFFTGTIDTLEEFPRFPCGATFNGTLAAPHQEFWVPYSWCDDHCPGWPVTKADNFNKWLKPMISFVLPSLIFCLNIPRRRRLELHTKLFSNESINVSNILFFIVKVPLASLIVTLDIIIWTCVVFSVAGPMITSGIYEALLDARALTYLESRITENTLTVQQNAHALLSILIGNLDDDAWHSSRLFVQALPRATARKRLGSIRSAREHSASTIQSPLIVDVTTPDQSYNADWLSVATESTTVGGLRNHLYSVEQQRQTAAAKWRLRAMLDSQVSFGSSVGAPVLFYVASYIWSVYEVREELGSYITAHQLGSGMFWMTIPHVALVSCLLLAGNNPNIWQSAVAQNFLEFNNPFTRDVRQYAATGLDSDFKRAQNGLRAARSFRSFIQRIFDQIFALAYKDSVFKPAWMWNRGLNKAMWITRLGEEYPYLQGMRAEVLEKRFGMDLWTSSLYGFVLYSVPTIFGIIVSYNTPQVGFGCRSIILLTYIASQICLQALWVLRWYFFDHSMRENVKTFRVPTAKSIIIRCSWYSLFMFAALLGALTSIGGTIFVLTNVLTNCFCAIPAKYWWDRWSNPNALIFVDDATYEQIYYAQKYWFPTGVVGVVFMVIVTYIGWWYQRSLRQRFHALVAKIDYVNERTLLEEERLDAEMAVPVREADIHSLDNVYNNIRPD
ncbi:hypothetical protein F4677DRAFT_406944 [Hypoxylon crocopeplum]|nr:hypothetical protein F4677DRAFT_406944 [Hypoxylon crocopeplum]